MGGSCARTWRRASAARPGAYRRSIRAESEDGGMRTKSTSAGEDTSSGQAAPAARRFFGMAAAATQERAKTFTRHLVASSGLHFAAATVLLAAGCGDAAWYADRGEPRPARQILCQTLQRVRVRALGKSRGAGANKLANAVQAALRHGTRLLYDVADSPRSCE